jgi:putative nucleotidyltransferase with HDIG domain
MTYRTEVLEAVHAVPAMPAWAAQVLPLLRDPEYDMRELLNILEYDPGLTTNILRLANSAYFAGPNPITTVRDALVLLGTKRIFQLVLMNAISPVARRPLKGYGLTEGQLLQHSISTAVAAEQLCLKLHLSTPDIAFTGGLLHDLGKLVLGTYVELSAEPIMRAALDDGLSFEQAELQVLGIDHAEVGATLLQAWHLPEEIVRVVRFHHMPQMIMENTGAIDAVHLADAISRRNGLGVVREGEHYHIAQATLDRVKLTREVHESVTATMVAALQEILGALQLRPINYRNN